MIFGFANVFFCQCARFVYFCSCPIKVKTEPKEDSGRFQFLLLLAKQWPVSVQKAEFKQR